MFWGDGSYTGNLYVDNVQISNSAPLNPPTTYALPRTPLLSSGFEDGFNSWTATHGGVSVVTSPVYSGNYSMKCSDPWGSQAIESIGTQSHTYTEAEFYFDHNVAGSQALIAYLNGNGDPSVAMGISVQSGRLFVFVQDILPSYSYSQYELTGVTPSNWYKFALDASSTSAAIYVNSQKLTSISQTNIPATASVSVGLFYGNGRYTGNLYVDNVQISTSSTWSQTFVGPGNISFGNSVVQSSDGGYAIAGSTYSTIPYYPGSSPSDVYLVKTDWSGNMLWNKTYGVIGGMFATWEWGSSVVQLSDGGYAIAGTTGGYREDYNTFYLVKTDSAGNMQWSKTIGGLGGYEYQYYGSSVVQSSDGGYAIAGFTSPKLYGGVYDVYLVKIDVNGIDVNGN
jgi:hypothetical protein